MLLGFLFADTVYRTGKLSWQSVGTKVKTGRRSQLK